MPRRNVGLIASARWASAVAPPIPTTGLLEWYDPSDALTITSSGGLVTQMNDKSGNNRNFVAAGSFRPTLAAGSLISGRNNLDFVSGNRMDNTVNGTANQKPFSLFVVMKHAGAASYRAMVGAPSSGSLEFRITNAQKQDIVKNQVADIGQSTSVIPSNLSTVLGVTYSATGVYSFYLNGVLDGTATNDQSLNGAAATEYLGDAVGEPLVGSLGEIIKYDRVVNSTELAQIHAYLQNKWRGGYLDGTVGYVTSPYPGVLPASYTMLAKVIGPSNPTTAGTIASVRSGSAGEWDLQRYNSTQDRLRFAYTTSAGGSTTAFCQGPPITGSIDYVAITATTGGAAGTMSTWSSTDGITWTPTGFTATPPTSYQAASTPINIGRTASAANPWAGKIYWIECRDGLTPTSGNVLWRFDANEHVSGTTFTDARGRVWTLSTAAAIVH